MIDKANKIESLGDGVHKVTISFDITSQGHEFGANRNFPLPQVQKMIRSKTVQKSIKDGYSLGMYGHGARDKSQGYLANETNATTGLPQEAIGRINSLSIRDKIITYTMTLIETEGNKVKSIVKFLKNKIGGFSFVMNVPQGMFYGADFVLSPNFNGNRVTMDSMCGEGECALTGAMEDEVNRIIGDKVELFDEAMDLLSSQEDVYKAVEFKDRMTITMDAIKAEISEKDDVIQNLNTKLEFKTKQLIDRDTLSKDNVYLKKSLEDSEKQLSSTSELFSESSKREEELIAKVSKLEETIKATEGSIQENGLTITTDGVVGVSKDVFADLFMQENMEISPINTVTLDALSKPKQENQTGSFVNWGY